MTLVRPEWVSGDDFTMVSPEATKALGGDVAAAAVLARIRFRARLYGYDRDGQRWWRASLDDLADDLGLSAKQARRALTVLEREGMIARTQHAQEGSYDRTMSYAINYVEQGETRGTTDVPDRADGDAQEGTSHVPNRADVPVRSKKTTTSLSETDSVREEETSSARQVHNDPRPLPADWKPRWKPDQHTWEYAVTRIEHYGVDLVAIAENMVLWARDQGREPSSALYRTFLDNAKDKIIEMENRLERQENRPPRKSKWYETA